MWNEMTEEEKKLYKYKYIHQQFKEENLNYHYQRSSEKHKKERIHNQSIISRDTINLFNLTAHSNPNPSLNLNSSYSMQFELQLKNMFSSLRQKVIIRYFAQNNSDVNGLIKNPQIAINGKCS